MRTKENNIKNVSRAFTLIELLVVISIIALLSAIILAALSTAKTKGAIGAGLEFTSYNYHILGDQTLVYWNFNNCNAANSTISSDISGNNYTPTVLSGAVNCVIDTPLGSGEAFSFNNTEITANLPSAPIFNSATVSIWVKLALPIITEDLLRASNPSPTCNASYNDCIGLILNQSTIPPEISFPDIDTWLGIPYTLSANVWTNIAYTYNPCSGNSTHGCYTLYINGAQVGSKESTYNTLLTGSISNVQLGGFLGYFFNGYVDDLAIYNESLTAGQLSTLYQEGAAQHGLAVR